MGTTELPTTQKPNGSTGKPTFPVLPMIIGVAVAAVAVIAGILGIWCCCKSRKKAQPLPNPNPNQLAAETETSVHDKNVAADRPAREGGSAESEVGEWECKWEINNK